MTLNPPSLPRNKAEMKPNSKKEQEQVKAVDSSVPENTAVLPIALPTTENSVNGVSAHKVLQEVAELHAKLQASLVQQVGSRTSKENLIKGSQLGSAILNGHCKQKNKRLVSGRPRVSLLCTIIITLFVIICFLSYKSFVHFALLGLVICWKFTG